jgi:hypothetical protein
VDKLLREHIGRKEKASSSSPARKAPPEKLAAPHEGAVPPGTMDVGATIRSKAKIVRTSELATQLETVQVLSMTTIKNLIKEAVDESAALLGPNLGDAARRRLLEEAEEAFNNRLEVFEAEKAGLEEKTHRLQEQLERAHVLLEDERNKVVSANQFTVSDAGMVELEQRLGRILDRTLKTGQVTVQVEQEMRSVVSRLLDDEREKIREQARQAQNDKIALLEKKIERLATSLESAEEERDRAQRRAQALEASGGLPLRSIMTAGLDQGDPDRDLKLVLLKEIFEINKEIREELASKGLLPIRQPNQPKVEASEATPVENQVPSTAKEAELPSSGGKSVESAQAAGAPAEESARGETSSDQEDKENEEETDEVPVLAAGGDADPDDLPWEPQEHTPAKGRERVSIKNLGGP